MSNNNESQVLKDLIDQIYFEKTMLYMFIFENKLTADWAKFSQEKTENLDFWKDKKDGK